MRLLGVEVRGPEAQRLLRLMGLPSAMAEFQGWLALGRGAGHGVGLSQWGAKGMAERGYGYREILGHYFPGTLLSPSRWRRARAVWLPTPLGPLWLEVSPLGVRRPAPPSTPGVRGRRGAGP